MGSKSWATVSEESLHKGFAAWTFLQSYMSERMQERGVRISQGQLSKLAVPLHFLRRLDADGRMTYLGFCLGNATWAALFWPVQIFTDIGSGFTGLYLDPHGEAQWEFLLEPMQWQVLEVQAGEFDGRIYMVPDESKTESLLKFFLRSESCRKNLLVIDMKVLGQHLQIPDFPKKSLRQDLMLALADFAADGDCDYVAQIKADMEKPEKAKVIGDALDEFVYGELPGEDQGDFKEVAKEVEAKKKFGWSMAAQKWKQATKPESKKKRKSKAAAKPKPKPKRQAKAKAKWKISRSALRSGAHAVPASAAPVP